jgi:hypothetical protein
MKHPVTGNKVAELLGLISMDGRIFIRDAAEVVGVFVGEIERYYEPIIESKDAEMERLKKELEVAKEVVPKWADIERELNSLCDSYIDLVINSSIRDKDILESDKIMNISVIKNRVSPPTE